MTELNLAKDLFDLFGEELQRLGLMVNEGKIIDASFVEAPRQRNSREENKEIKQGDELWQDKPNKKRQKDTDASVHDSQVVDDLLDESDMGQDLYADSAYVGQDDVLDKHKVNDQIHEKGYKNKPLTESQKARNKEKSKTRVRVEHVFGFMENSMGGMFFRKVGKKRAETTIGLMNLTYNMFRKIQLTEPIMGTCA